MVNRLCWTSVAPLLLLIAACGSALQAATAEATPVAPAGPSTPASVGLIAPSESVPSASLPLAAAASPSASSALSPASPTVASAPAAAARAVPAVDESPQVAAAAPAALPIVDGPRSVAVTQGDASRPRVALTFDAGADAGHTTAILDLLAAQHLTASFGVTGQWAEANPALLRRMVADGHLIINHTYSHASFTGLSTGAKPLTRAQRWAELDRTEAIIERITGVAPRPYFRPPYGDLDASVLADVGARGYTVTAMWSVDSLGWKGLPAPQIAERTLRLASPGAILIFHVGSASADAEALPAIVRGLHERGYGCGSLTTLLAPAASPPE